MIIECPHCLARLNLSEHVTGKQVRCPICRQVFRADHDTLKEAVQTHSSESASAIVAPKPRDEDERPRAKTRRLEVQADYNDHHDGCDFSPDNGALIENAKSLARPAGYAMLAAFGSIIADLISSVSINIATQNLGLAEGPQDVAITSICNALVLAPMLIFIGIGARSLFTFGSRGLIVTAVIMNFIVLSILGCGLGLNVLFTLLELLEPPNFALGTALAMASVCSVANLIAAVMAIRVLTFPEVADAFAVRAKDQRRRRY